MPLTLTQLTNNVLTKLDEKADSVLGALQSGTGAADVVTASATITKYLNEAQDEMAETCALLRVTASALAVTAGTRSIPISSLTPNPTTAARIFRAARDVRWTPTTGTGAGIERALTRCDFWTIQAVNRNYLDAANGSLTKWYRPDESYGNIGLYLPPDVAGSVIVSGYGYPVQLASGSDTVTWISDSHARALEFYAAGMLCRKGKSDPELAEKEGEMFAEYNRIRLTMLSLVEPSLAKMYLRADPTLGIGVKA